ncbi:hypothetical protein Tco_1365212 [Tanacetum coccineum]
MANTPHTHKGIAKKATRCSGDLRRKTHKGGDTSCVSQPDWPAIIVINHYQAPQITAGQSGCDTQPDVPTLTCAPEAHVRKTPHIGVDLNDEATDSEDVEIQEVRPLGRDAAKKKRASSGARSESSVAGDPSLVDALRELKLKDQRRREQGELERLKIAQKDKELELQEKMFKFQQQQKFEEDIKREKAELALRCRSPVRSP